VKSADLGRAQRTKGAAFTLLVKMGAGKLREAATYPVDAHGLMLNAIVCAADIQNRDGGTRLMAPWFGLFLFLLNIYADGGDQGADFRTR
jgi:hypothetical protein